MAKRSDTDKAIRNIMNWAERPDWSNQQKIVFDAHLNPVCERIGISQQELVQELEDHSYMHLLFGLMFEDFLSHRMPPDDRNVIDDYLKRRGWRESVPGRRYLQQLRNSTLSLYEVVEVSPGHHCDLRDLVRKGKTMRVHERSGTQNMVKWDHIAARVLNNNGKYIFSGGILPYPREAAQDLLKLLSRSKKRFDKEFSRIAGEEIASSMLSEVNMDDQFLQGATLAFTSIWLMQTLESIRAPLPELVNRDSEALMFTETRFPFLAEQFDEISQRLDDSPEWQRDIPGEHSWTWFQEPNPAGNRQQHGIALESFQGGQHPISGTLELTSTAITLTTNSMERAQRGQHVLETLLQGLIGPALSKLQTPEQLIAERETTQHSYSDGITADSVDPEIAAEIISNYLDRHYRQTLDEPVPVLDNKSPRQCVKSKKGRKMVVEWLKHLENSELRRAASQGQKPYDSRWMWQELKLDSTDT